MHEKLQNGYAFQIFGQNSFRQILDYDRIGRINYVPTKTWLQLKLINVTILCEKQSNLGTDYNAVP